MENTVTAAGFARLEIDPPLGLRIGGYFNARFVKGYLDPLYVNAIAFREGERVGVMLVMDLLAIWGRLSEEWPVAIEKELGLAEHTVFITNIHSHTTPSVGLNSGKYAGWDDEQYNAWLFRRMCDAAKLAIEDAREIVDVRTVQGETVEMTFVRRYYMKDGSVMMNPPFRKPEDRAQMDRPACETDETFRVIRIMRAEGPDVVVVNYQTHPDSIGGELISADFPGALRRRVEEKLPNTRCVYVNGAEGQMNRVNRIHPEPPIPPEKKYEDCVQYGEKLGDLAVELFDKAVSTGRRGFASAAKTIWVKSKYDPDLVPEARRIVELYDSGRKSEIAPTERLANAASIGARRIISCYESGLKEIDLPIITFQFCGVVFAGVPGEPFNELGKRLRASSPFPMTCVCCITNGAGGYFATAEAYDQGGYEPNNSSCAKGVLEAIGDACEELIATL